MSPARRWIRELVSSPAKIVTVVVVATGLVWWQWPLISGQDSRTDVVLLTDRFLTSTERPVTYRIHEDGRSLRWDAEATSWCDAAEAVQKIEAEADPAAFVLSFADADGCDGEAVTKAVQAAKGHTVLVVAQPGRSGLESAAAQSGATLIDPSSFIGDQLTGTAMPCQWWETCTADGTIAVRTADCALTAEGGDRVARLIVAQLP